MATIALANEMYLNNDTVQARIAELQGLIQPGIPNYGMSDEDRAELDALVAFQAACEADCSDWAYGDSAINEEQFLAHITDLIDECYEIKRSDEWPYRHMTMDYAAAADEARSDYTSIELDGVTFYVR